MWEPVRRFTLARYTLEIGLTKPQFTVLAIEVLRSMIDHTKVLVLALNGPAVGGGAAWFEGVADIMIAADNSYLQVPFSALGLVPEYGSASHFAHSIGIRRTNDFLMFGRKLTAQELEQWGLVNRIFPAEGFHDKVIEFLEEQLIINDGKSMMEVKRLQNWPLRRQRMLAVYDAAEALAERFVEDGPRQRFAEKNRIMRGKKSPHPDGVGRAIGRASNKADQPTEKSTAKSKL